MRTLIVLGGLALLALGTLAFMTMGVGGIVLLVMFGILVALFFTNERARTAMLLPVRWVWMPGRRWLAYMILAVPVILVLAFCGETIMRGVFGRYDQRTNVEVAQDIIASVTKEGDHLGTIERILDKRKKTKNGFERQICDAQLKENYERLGVDLGIARRDSLMEYMGLRVEDGQVTVFKGHGAPPTPPAGATQATVGGSRPRAPTPPTSSKKPKVP